jgi:hypothetical protein
MPAGFGQGFSAEAGTAFVVYTLSEPEYSLSKKKGYQAVYHIAVLFITGPTVNASF